MPKSIKTSKSSSDPKPKPKPKPKPSSGNESYGPPIGGGELGGSGGGSYPYWP